MRLKKKTLVNMTYASYYYYVCEDNHILSLITNDAVVIASCNVERDSSDSEPLQRL